MPEQNINPEQLKALQEKIKNMSPEELKDFQKQQCIFCQIISGKVQAKKVYEDEKVLGVLDINPANPGHILILTKEHYSIMPQVPEDEISHIFMVVKSLSNTMLRGIDAQGTNIIVANGVAAGQRAQHFMVHLIPRKENDGLNFVLPQKTIEMADIEAIGNKLISSLNPSAEKEEAQVQIPMPLPQPKAQQQKTIFPIPKNKEPKKESVKKEEPKQTAKSGIDLDDIAKFLGVK